LELALNIYSSTHPVAVGCPPEGQCILSSILPPPSCHPNKRDCSGKKPLCKVARAPVLQTSKKELMYIVSGLRQDSSGRKGRRRLFY
jgi:hypothetical protein